MIQALFQSVAMRSSGCVGILALMLTGLVGTTTPASGRTPLSHGFLIAATPNALPAWMQALKLTPEQTTQVQAIEAKYKPQAQQQQTQLNQAEAAMEKLLVEGASNEDIRAQHQVVQNYRRQLEATRLEAGLEIKGVLTPAQRQQLAELNRQRLVRLRDAVQANPTSQK